MQRDVKMKDVAKEMFLMVQFNLDLEMDECPPKGGMVPGFCLLLTFVFLECFSLSSVMLGSRKACSTSQMENDTKFHQRTGMRNSIKLSGQVVK